VYSVDHNYCRQKSRLNNPQMKMKFLALSFCPTPNAFTCDFIVLIGHLFDSPAIRRALFIVAQFNALNSLRTIHRCTIQRAQFTAAQFPAHNSSRHKWKFRLMNSWFCLITARWLLNFRYMSDIWRLNCSRWLLNAAISLLNYAKWLLDVARRLLTSARWLIEEC
jgi:hypothetical protein